MERVKLFAPHNIITCHEEVASLIKLTDQQQPLYRFQPGKGFLISHGFSTRTKPNYLSKENPQRHINRFIQKNVVKCFNKRPKQLQPIVPQYQSGSQKINPALRKTAYKFRLRRRRASVQSGYKNHEIERNVVLQDILQIKKELLSKIKN